jgi:hypothetical protein
VTQYKWKLSAVVLLVVLMLFATGCQGTVSIGTYVPGPYVGPFNTGVYVGGTVPIW